MVLTKVLVKETSLASFLMSQHCTKIKCVKKGSSQDDRNFTLFFYFENNKISREGLRVSRDTFAYKEYGIRLMLAPRSASALQEKVSLKLHGKLPRSPSLGGTLFWIISELSSLKKVAKICSILCLLLMSSLRNLLELGISTKTSTRDRVFGVLHEIGVLCTEHPFYGHGIYSSHNFISNGIIGAFSGKSDSFLKGWLRLLVFRPLEFEQDLVLKELTMIKDFDDVAFRNSNCGTGSRSDKTVDSPHGFVIYRVIVLKGIEKVTKVVEIKDWNVDSGGKILAHTGDRASRMGEAIGTDEVGDICILRDGPAELAVGGDGGLSEVSISDESVQMNREVYCMVEAVGGIVGVLVGLLGLTNPVCVSQIDEPYEDLDDDEEDSEEDPKMDLDEEKEDPEIDIDDEEEEEPLPASPSPLPFKVPLSAYEVGGPFSLASASVFSTRYELNQLRQDFGILGSRV
uniref:Uncharacterized protein n=1 Tax=Tanacetum cinerariifolium TaxID=118510 RepID=A0A6L2NPU8_TANCI|nr:hypothetical protein [Tanacetum cinerariifolium]